MAMNIIYRFVTISLLVAVIVVSGIPTLIGPAKEAAAQGPVYEYIQYTVKKGGTLWDISTEVLENPFLWPRVWQVNPEIKNADLIFPGQVIRIPVALVKPELRPAASPIVTGAVEPAETDLKKTGKEESLSALGERVDVQRSRELASPDVIASAGFITGDLHTVGTVIGSPGDKSIFATYDTVYINAMPEAQVGDRFTIYKMIKPVKHPETREKVGSLYEVLGAIEIVEKGSKVDVAEVVTSYSQIELGSLVGDYLEQEPPIVGALARTPNTKGYVLLLKSLKHIGGLYDGLYVDKGEIDGILPGDVFSIVRQDRRYHDRTIGKIEIVRVMKKTATAIVLNSSEEIEPGDLVSSFRNN